MAVWTMTSEEGLAAYHKRRKARESGQETP